MGSLCLDSSLSQVHADTGQGKEAKDEFVSLFQLSEPHPVCFLKWRLCLRTYKGSKIGREREGNPLQLLFTCKDVFVTIALEGIAEVL